MIILIVAGGAENATGSLRRLSLLANALQKSGVLVSVATNDARGFSHISPGTSIHEDPQLSVGSRSAAGKTLRFVQAMWALVRPPRQRLIDIVAASTPDVIICRNGLVVMQCFRAARRAGAAIVWDIGIESRVPIIRTMIVWIAAACSHVIIVQSPRLVRSVLGPIAGRVFHGSVRAVLPGIAPMHVDRDQRARGLSARPPAILHVGTITPRKGQLTTIRAFIEARRHSPAMSDVHLSIVGPLIDAEYGDALRREIHDGGVSDCVHLLGWRDDVEQLMLGATAVVMPSQDEGVSNVLQEAMYMGCPVVTSAAGGAPDLIEHGRTGWLVSDLTITAWTAALRDLFANPELMRAMGDAAAEYARLNFDVHKWAERYLQEIVPVVARAKSFQERT